MASGNFSSVSGGPGNAAGGSGNRPAAVCWQPPSAQTTASGSRRAALSHQHAEPTSNAPSALRPDRTLEAHPRPPVRPDRRGRRAGLHARQDRHPQHLALSDRVGTNTELTFTGVNVHVVNGAAARAARQRPGQPHHRLQRPGQPPRRRPHRQPQPDPGRPEQLLRLRRPRRRAATTPSAPFRPPSPAATTTRPAACKLGQRRQGNTAPAARCILGQRRLSRTRPAGPGCLGQRRLRQRHAAGGEAAVCGGSGNAASGNYYHRAPGRPANQPARTTIGLFQQKTAPLSLSGTDLTGSPASTSTSSAAAGSTNDGTLSFERQPDPPAPRSPAWATSSSANDAAGNIQGDVRHPGQPTTSSWATGTTTPASAAWRSAAATPSAARTLWSAAAATLPKRHLRPSGSPAATATPPERLVASSVSGDPHGQRPECLGQRRSGQHRHSGQRLCAGRRRAAGSRRSAGHERQRRGHGSGRAAASSRAAGATGAGVTPDKAAILNAFTLSNGVGTNTELSISGLNVHILNGPGRHEHDQRPGQPHPRLQRIAQQRRHRHADGQPQPDLGRREQLQQLRRAGRRFSQHHQQHVCHRQRRRQQHGQRTVRFGQRRREQHGQWFPILGQRRRQQHGQRQLCLGHRRRHQHGRRRLPPRSAAATSTRPAANLASVGGGIGLTASGNVGQRLAGGLTQATARRGPRGSFAHALASVPDVLVRPRTRPRRVRAAPALLRETSRTKETLHD